jgi:hypothetical protein
MLMANGEKATLFRELLARPAGGLQEWGKSAAQVCFGGKLSIGRCKREVISSAQLAAKDAGKQR